LDEIGILFGHLEGEFQAESDKALVRSIWNSEAERYGLGRTWWQYAFTTIAIDLFRILSG
jgi:hypothetical protein